MRVFFPPFPGAEEKALTPKSIGSSPWFYGESYKPVSSTPSTAKGNVRGASHSCEIYVYAYGHSWFHFALCRIASFGDHRFAQRPLGRPVEHQPLLDWNRLPS